MHVDVRALRCAILLSAGPCLVAASLPKSSPEEVGLAADRLKRVHTLVERYIDIRSSGRDGFGYEETDADGRDPAGFDDQAGRQPGGDGSVPAIRNNGLR